MDALERRLSQLIFTYWHIPAREGRLLLKLLSKSSASRAVTLRHHLAIAELRIPTVLGNEEVDLRCIFAQVVTPGFMMSLLRDLCAIGSLSVSQCAIIEDFILDCVSATGTWKAV